MQITIKYTAKLSYTDGFGVHHEDELCSVVHIIDNKTLKTLSFDFTPVKEPKGV